MVPFAGYHMPVQYEGVNLEHLTVRNGVGVFDVSHMGEFLVEGPNALELIQKITSNDASKLNVGDAQYSCFQNDTNGIVDDLICYRIKEETYLLVVNASNIDKDLDWVNKHNEGIGANLRNVSDDYSLLAIQGPKAVEAMQSLTSIDLAEIPFYKFKIADFAGVPYAIISATVYTGSGGFEIYVKNEEAEQVWKLSVTPSLAPRIIAEIQSSFDIESGLDWAGGLIWLSGSGEGLGTHIRQVLAANGGGHATLMRGSDSLRDNQPVFQPLGEAVGGLQTRIKTAFDPENILNPQRINLGGEADANAF